MLSAEGYDSKQCPAGRLLKAFLMHQDAAINEPLRQDIARVVVPRDKIAARVEALASEIAAFYLRDTPADQTEVTILAVLTGSLVFLSDLIRHLPLKIRIDVISASSYPGPRTSPAELALQMPVEADLRGRDVLIVDDILDTGGTLSAILAAVADHHPLSVRSCVLLAKRRSDRPETVQPDFCGFVIEPEFVVGYGLDYDDLYRNLPDVCTLKAEALAAVQARGDRGPGL